MGQSLSLRARPTSSNSSTSSLSSRPKLSSKHEATSQEIRETNGTPPSRSVDIKEEGVVSIGKGETQSVLGPSPEPLASFKTTHENGEKNVEHRAPGVAHGSGMEATTKDETERLKVTLRALEKKRQGDFARLNSLDALQADKDRYEGIIKKLQTKLQNSHHEINELRDKLLEAESKVQSDEYESMDYDTELQLARIDKETAEEKAEVFESELKSLNTRIEELELETEVLRKEKNELSSITNPEESSSAGWIQKDRENDRLREALIKLRDSTQQEENTSRARIKVLENEVLEYEKMKEKHSEMKGKLLREERVNRHLKEQIEAAESQEEINLSLEIDKERYRKHAEELQAQILALQDEAEVNDELDQMHRENEKELETLLDTKQAQLIDSEREKHQQARVLEDLEVALKKYRSTVSDLQKDVDKLRESQNLTEAEASEMQVKSRAIMDLNLKLQNTAAKGQLKAIDVELGRIDAEESAHHLSMIQLFLPKSFETEKNPILALLCLKRIRSKVSLVQSIMQEQVKELVESTYENVFSVFDIRDKLVWISSSCDQFTNFMSSCSVEEFANFVDAAYELEPVERVVNSWIEVLRRSEIKKTQGAEELQGIIAILSDLLEKLVPSNLGGRASKIMAKTAGVEGYCESATLGFGAIRQNMQQMTKVTDGNLEDMQHFCNKMEHFGAKSRTVSYVASKVYKGLQKLSSDGLTLAEPICHIFEQAEQLAQGFSALVRKIGSDLWVCVHEEGREEQLSFAEAQQVIVGSTKTFVQQRPEAEWSIDEVTAHLTNMLQSIHAKVNEMLGHASDLSRAIEFEQLPAPWIVRANELRDRKVLDSETQNQLRRLKADLQECLVTLAGRNKLFEEQQIKIQLLESRNKESRNQAAAAQKLSAELKAAQQSRDNLVRDLETVTEEHKALLLEQDDAKIELASLRQSRAVGDGSSLTDSVNVARNAEVASKLTTEIDMKSEEIRSLQSAVRFLKLEAYRSRIQAASTAKSAHHTWLHPSALVQHRADNRTRNIAAESQGVFSRLIELATSIKPVALKPSTLDEQASTWRTGRSTPRHQVCKQWEEMERWSEWRDDLVGRAAVNSAVMSRKTSSIKKYRISNISTGDKPMSTLACSQVLHIDGVQVLDSPA